jgi:hypothetical protein
LLLDAVTQHLLNVAAPGRITRRFSFEAKAGLELSVHLGRALVLPSASDPEPLASEWVTDYPEDPFSWEEIDRAFAKLDRYAKCLALTNEGESDVRRGGSRVHPHADGTGQCMRLLEEANPLKPQMAELRSAGEAYLQAMQGGPRSASLHRLLATFRSEFLTVQSAWQREELGRQETEEGRTAAWHMRRLVLAGLAWFRQSRSASAPARGLEERRVKLTEYQQAFLAFTQHSQQEMARISGSEEFTKAAERLIELARSSSGKKSSEGAGLEACRQLLTAFNALVVD